MKIGGEQQRVTTRKERSIKGVVLVNNIKT